MARAKGRLHQAPTAATPRRSRRNVSQENSEVPDVFQDLMLEEDALQEADNARPAKKRKIRHAAGQSGSAGVPEVEMVPLPKPPVETVSRNTSRKEPRKPSRTDAVSHATKDVSPIDPAPDEDLRSSGRVRQTIEDSDESEDSDMEWEDALGDGRETDDEDEEPSFGDISITLGGEDEAEDKPKRKVRRRAITSVDRKRRLDIHKVHILCLLYHVHRRNAWCTDRRVQYALREIVSPKLLMNLIPDPALEQYQSSKRFIEGLGQLKLLWSKRFKITAKGMYKPRWAEADSEARPFSDFDDLDDPMDLDDFRNAASKLQGSQDVGAQLFCALLRSIGVETRLVCSLQCLPFASAAQPSTPQKQGTGKNTIVLDPYNSRAKASPRSKKLPKPSRLEAALGERHSALRVDPSARSTSKYQSPYPVYWVEVYNTAYQKWVPIDPLCTFTINSPEKLEPPLHYAQNSLTYAIAFDDDYTAKDVTRRYAKAYNAKTRKFRVECTPGGPEWMRRALAFFKRRNTLDRDQVEDAALARKEAAEGMPKNVQDFKDHPVYVLERHLRQNQVIHPLNQVGKINVGTSMNPKMMPIYRRKDVHIVRSADKWYRLGRDVVDGEQPLKHAKPKRGRQLSIGQDVDMDEQQEEVGAGLYAEFQTEVYIPPPVVRGRVPRNAFGNLDLYVPSMCPPGGTHVRHKLAAKAARIVGVDYADAVTGFSFKGRHGTAIVQGVVVTQEYAAAVEAIIDAMEYASEEAENKKRVSEALRMWRRFFLGLKIAQRVNAIEIDGKKGPVIDVQEEVDREDKVLEEQQFAGGFFPDEGSSAVPVAPTGRGYVPPPPPREEEDYGGGFVPDGEDEDEADDGENNSAEQGGGFVVEDDDEAHPIPLERHRSFGSVILSQQQLAPRRTSSFEAAHMEHEDEVEDEYWPRDFGLPVQTGELGGGFPHSSEVEASRGDAKQVKVIEEGKGDELGPEMRDAEEQQPQQADLDMVMDEQGADADGALEKLGSEAVVEVEEQSVPASSESDAGSLPLEDPEDEDADPDWLVEAT